MGKREGFWVPIAAFFLFFCIGITFSDSYIIGVVAGILSFPIALSILITDVKINRNKKFMKLTIEQYIHEKTFPKNIPTEEELNGPIS